MSATKRKSKRRSAASFPPQHDEPVFFLDRNLGRHVVASRLRAVGMPVELHDDHLPAHRVSKRAVPTRPVRVLLHHE